MFRKKGQAALEFLTTYGWAFLVILVMIGALSYFGVLDPSRYAPDSCKLSGIMECTGPSAVTHLDAGSTIELRVLNNNPNSVSLTNVVVSEKAEREENTAKMVLTEGGDNVIAAFDQEDVTIIMVDGALTKDMAGEKKVFLIDIYYTTGDSSIESVVQGTITTSVQSS